MRTFAQRPRTTQQTTPSKTTTPESARVGPHSRRRPLNIAPALALRSPYARSATPVEARTGDPSAEGDHFDRAPGGRGATGVSTNAGEMSPGRGLDSATRTFFEQRFGRDFGAVRIHADAAASAHANRMGAVAFTVGRDIHFAANGFRPDTATGRWVLAHELAHVVQQGGGAAERVGMPLPNAEPSAESEADRAATAIAVGERAAVAADGRGPRVHRLTEAAFRAALGTTPEQRAAIDALFANADFLALWNYLRLCGALPAQDLGPLALRVTPGLVIRGVVRFGGYNPGSRTLEINPTKPEHVSNPSELVDTITHEMIHAVDDLQAACTAAGSGPSPLAASGAATVAPVAAGTPGFAAALATTGPSASDPCGETIDENAAAQQIIGRVIQSNITVARVGHPTLTFVNLILRSDPAALAFYNACRTSACALPTAAARTTAMTDCSQQTIARFLPPAMTAALLPARVYFEFDRATLRTGDRETLHLIALFLTSHPAISVKLIGHADQTGPAGYNLGLGQRRAGAVKAFLLGEGVPAAQITSATSVGETGATAVAAEMWRDRSVEITP